MTADPRRLLGRLRRQLGTVRFRVSAVATLAAAAVLIVAGLGLLAAQRRQLTDSLDNTIRQRADDLTALVDGGRIPRALGGPIDPDTLVQIVTPDGNVLAAGPNVATPSPMADPPPPNKTEVVRRVHLPPDNGEYRLLSRRHVGPNGTNIIHVAGTLDDVRDSLRVLAASLTIAIPIVAILLAALIFWLVGRTLRPVEAIRAEVANIRGADLHRRVPQPPRDDEIGRLAGTMNDMLDRLERATNAQQRFVADASHELRSLLTRLRSELEVDAAHPEVADLTATHRSVLDETIALQRLVDDLLLLARGDAGAVTGRREPVDLDDIVLRHADRLRAEGRVTVDVGGVSAAQVIGDGGQLNRAMRNLVDNAARHARTTVAFTVSENHRLATLTITDDGPGIPEALHEHVFERFVRLDETRRAGDGNTGLGLAITRDIVEQHGGRITIDAAHVSGTRFVIVLPTTPDDFL
jgi:signal transduction histidine kinase